MVLTIPIHCVYVLKFGYPQIFHYQVSGSDARGINLSDMIFDGDNPTTPDAGTEGGDTNPGGDTNTPAPAEGGSNE